MNSTPFPRLPLLKAAALLSAALALALSLPPLRALIEQSMVWHMLVQMPLLVAAGACAAAAWPRALGGRWARFNRYGLTGFMLAQCITAYWMVPALVDRAVVLPSADAGKLATLWLAGVALRQGWVQAPLAVQLFFLGYGLPMMAWLGFYFLSTDLRLCNAYSMESQLRTGQGLLLLSALLGLAWAASLWRQLAPAARPALLERR
jgi:hypothetical protein